MIVTVCHQAEKCRGLLLQHMGLAGVLLFVRYLIVWGNLAEATVAQHPLSHCRVPSIWYSREGKMKRKAFSSRNYFACTTLKLFYVCLSPPFFSPQQTSLAKFTVSTRLFLQKIRNISGLPRGWEERDISPPFWGSKDFMDLYTGIKALTMQRTAL